MGHGNIKFLHAGKTNTDYGNYLESEFLDFRTSEERTISLSQSMYLPQELPSATINLPFSYFVCITNCAEIAHLTWVNRKETAALARDTLQRHPICGLSKEIGISE